MQRTISQLRQDALNAAEGALIGSEESLIRRYGVSRPTLRQAAALVRQEQLLSVRRGVSGGYFAARPKVSAVSHMAAIYLRTRATGAAEMLRGVELIRREMVRRAAQADDPDARAALARFLAEDEAAQAAGSYGFRQFAAAERDYARLLGALCGDDVLHLFLEILLELLGSAGADLPYFDADRLAASLDRRGRVVRAVLNGDPEIAAIEADRGMRQVESWIAETRAGQGKAD